MAEVRVDGRRLALAFPQTYMNDSGRSVAALVRRFGIADLDRLVIVHDELDLPLGTVRVKAGGGLAGHNGLRSIKAHLHTDDFTRVRIGIGKPPGRQGKRRRPRAAGPSRRERTELEVSIEVAADAVECILDAKDVRSRPEPVQWLTCLPTLRTLAAPLAPCCRCCATTRPSPACAGSRSGIVAVPEPARAFAVAGWPRLPAGARPSWPSRPTPRPSGWPTTSTAFLGPRPGRRSARPGRRCRSSGSAPASRPWAAGCGPCGGCAAARRGHPERLPPGSGGAGPGAAPAARAPRRGRRARWSIHRASRSTPQELVSPTGRHGLPPRVPGRAPGRAGRAGLDRRRVRLHRRRAGPHRPVGRRGRPADRVLGRRPALDRRPRPRSSCSAAASCCRPTRSAQRAARLVGEAPWGREQWERLGRGPGLRRHGVVAAVADRRRAPAGRPAARRRPGAAGRAPPDARPGRRAARRGGRPGGHPGPDVGRGRTRSSPACTCRSTGCWPTPTPPS